MVYNFNHPLIIITVEVGLFFPYDIIIRCTGFKVRHLSSGFHIRYLFLRGNNQSSKTHIAPQGDVEVWSPGSLLNLNLGLLLEACLHLENCRSNKFNLNSKVYV